MKTNMRFSRSAAVGMTVLMLALSVDLPVAHAQSTPQAGSAYAFADAAYIAYARGDYSAAAGHAREAVRLAPDNRDYGLLLVNALAAAGQLADADAAATQALAARGRDAELHARRGAIRQQLGRTELANEDFDAALSMGTLRMSTEITLLAQRGRGEEARKRFDAGRSMGALADVPDTELAYLATRVGDDVEASAAFNRANAAGKLVNTAYLDAAFAALRAHRDELGADYFRRGIDEAQAGRLNLSPQELFAARRAVSEVSRKAGLFASLTYRGAVSGFGQVPGAATDSVQAGLEGYWRPWGYRNSRYAEVFARAFETLGSRDGAAGTDTVQAGVGIRHKPFSELNVVLSLSYVMAPPSAPNDWLAQIGYSGGIGSDLRVDTDNWWTTRVFAEAGRYLSSGQKYALVQAEAGRSLRLAGRADSWVLFPHLSLASDYQSNALLKSTVGAGPGINARYWFRADAHHAPQSYLDITLQYRWRLGGAQRAEGTFLTTTLSY